MNCCGERGCGLPRRGLNHLAQGCARRATLGVCPKCTPHPVRVASAPRRVHSPRHAATGMCGIGRGEGTRDATPSGLRPHSIVHPG